MPQEVPLEILQKLAAAAERMARLEDESITTALAEIRERDPHGKILHAMSVRSRIERRGGRTMTRVIEATRDGRDDRAAAQKRADEQDRGGRKESPFAASQQLLYRFLVDDRGGEAQARIAIAPRGGISLHPDVMIGEARVDLGSGECLALSGRPFKPAALVEKAEFSFEYAPTPRGMMLSAMTLDYAGGILFIRRQGDLRVTFAHEPRAQGG